MHRLIAITKAEDIPAEFKDTPIGNLFEYHNLKAPHKKYTEAKLLIGMCMDNRKRLNLPENFAYILRTGGANLRHNDFHISYAIAVGGVQYVALIGHTQCGMSQVSNRKQKFVEGLHHNAGWDMKKAEDHFKQDAPKNDIGIETDFILSETKRLSARYPKIKAVPLIYKVEDHLLYWISDKVQS